MKRACALLLLFACGHLAAADMSIRGMLLQHKNLPIYVLTSPQSSDPPLLLSVVGTDLFCVDFPAPIEPAEGNRVVKRCYPIDRITRLQYAEPDSQNRGLSVYVSN